MVNNYIKDKNGNFIIYSGKFNKHKMSQMIVNNAYKLKNKIYIFRGEGDISLKNTDKLENGLYYYIEDMEIKLFKSGKESYNEEDVIQTSTKLKVDSDIIEEISKKGNELKKIIDDKNKEKKSNKRKAKPKRKLENQKRNKRDEIIYLGIREDDNLLVRTIKNEINSKKITMNDIYEYSPKCGYNMFYGISTRSTITWEIFEKWCDFLNFTPTIILEKK